MTYLIDTHCHLDFPELYADLDMVLERAKAQSIKKFITIGVKIKDSVKLLEIANKYENVFCAIGTHPGNAAEETAITLEELIEYSTYKKVVAFGETGLDYHYQPEQAEIQKKSFLKHIAAAQHTNLPLVIHTRKADEDMQDILTAEHAKMRFNFVLHCYSSGIELAKAALAIGGYISFSGILTFKNAAEIREIAKIVPKNQVLLETDAPYLAPIPYRGRSNEPAYIVETAKILAQILEIPYEEVVAQTTKNALRLFNKMHND